MANAISDKSTEGQGGAEVDVSSAMIGAGIGVLRAWEFDEAGIPLIVRHGTLVSRVYWAMEAERRRENGHVAIGGGR